MCMLCARLERLSIKNSVWAPMFGGRHGPYLKQRFSIFVRHTPILRWLFKSDVDGGNRVHATARATRYQPCHGLEGGGTRDYSQP